MEIIPPLSSLIPPVTNTPKQRADLLSIKLRLAAILPPADGLVYWHALSDFLNGKITRQELGLVLKKVLSPSSEALQLHNALLLSILYNTTRTSLPPISVRHSGWQKRKRDKDGATLEDRDPKRRKLKASVMAIGKRERAELKALVAVGRKGKEERGLLSASLESRGAKFDKDGFPVDVAEAKDPEPLHAEYLRCLQTQLCCESKLLPDVDTLQDRMSLVAYESGLESGADNRVAALGVQAIEGHLKSILASVVSLVRSNRSSNLSSSVPSQDPTTPSNHHPEITLSTNQQQTTTLHPHASDSEPSRTPLTTSDFHALFEISPHLLILPHLGTIERLYAIPPPSDSDSSDDPQSDEESSAPIHDQQNSSSAVKDSSTNPGGGGRSASGGARSSRSTSNGNGAGREQYLIDPSAVAIPWGHPDVAHPRIGSLSLPTTPSITTTTTSGTTTKKSSSTSLPVTLGTSGSGGNRPTTTSGQMSPKSLSLRNKLFPELEAQDSLNGGGGVIVDSPRQIGGGNGHRHSPSLDTTTDGASESDEAAVMVGTKVKSGTMGKNGVRKEKMGRKLWEVVDSVRLLDGVLD